MDEVEQPSEKRMRLRYAGSCRVCGAALPAKTEAIYERSSKSVRCLSHDQQFEGPRESPGEVESGVPGASARREFERRKTKREEDIRRRHPKFGGLILALSDDPQSTKAWDTGAVGEEKLGRKLNELASETLLVLHDRRRPGTKANIDHLVVTPTGVWVVDAKKYKGRPQLKVEGGLLRPRVEKLVVGGRDRTSAVDGVLKQVEAVRDLLDDAVPVHGVLCFIDADWPMVGGAFTTRGVQVLWPKKLYALLMGQGPIDAGTIEDIHRHLGSALVSA